MPSLERASGCSVRMSLNLKSTRPLTACTSPLLTESETPLRISRPSTLTRRSLISKSAIVSVSLPVDSVFKSNSVLLLVRVAVERDPKRVDGQRCALHPCRADRNPELIKQVPRGETLELLHRLADDHVGQHRGGRLADGATPTAEPHIPYPAVV